MNNVKYHNILKEHLISPAMKLNTCRRPTFQQDNDKHTAELTQDPDLKNKTACIGETGAQVSGH